MPIEIFDIFHQAQASSLNSHLIALSSQLRLLRVHMLLLRRPSRQRNALDLHLHPLRQLMHRNAAPRRLRRPIHPKMLHVFLIDLGEILHVRQEHGRLHDLGDVGAAGGEDGFEVGDAEGGLVGDGAGGELARRGGGDLAGNVDGVRGEEGLGLGAGLGCVERWVGGQGVRRVLLLLGVSVVYRYVGNWGWGDFTRACVLCVDRPELGHLASVVVGVVEVSELGWSSGEGFVRDGLWNQSTLE